jgi:hypothetical protein
MSGSQVVVADGGYLTVQESRWVVTGRAGH